MAIIYSYPQFAPKPEDLLIGTVTLDENAVVPIYDNPTVSFTIQSLLDMIAPITGAQNLQQVTNIGATTSNAVTFTSDIKVTGRFYDSGGSPGAAGQVLSSTVTGTSWIVNAPASVTSVGLTMPAAFSVANSPVTTAGVLTVTGAGTALQYVNGLGNLVTFPTIPTQYVLPLAASGTRGGIQIGYTSAGKNYAIQLSSEKAFVNVPWTDTSYTLPAATNAALGGIKIGYTDNLKNYAVELDGDSEAYVNVPWTDTAYTLPLAADGTRGGVQIGYTQASTRDYPVTLTSEKMLVTVPWTDTQNANQTITGVGSDNTDSGIILSASGGTVLVLGAGSVTAAQSGNTITLTGTDTDTGVTGVTVAIADSTGAPLSESITNRELTLTSHKYVGGTNVGYVPEGGTGDLYLKGDGTWAAVPTGLQFKGTWDASSGGGGSPDLTLAANQGDGFLWITSVAGTAYPNGGSAAPSTWNVGDWAVYVGAAGSGTWTRVPATNSGVTSITTTDGTYVDLTPNAATTGAVTVTADLSAADGTSDVNTKFLSKDNTWDVPSYTGAGVTTFTSVEGTYIDITDNTAATGAVGLGTVDLNAVNGTSVVGTRFLSKDNTWDVPSYTTNTNTTYDFLAIEAVPTATVNTTPPMGTGYTSAVNAATTGGSGSGMTVDTVVASGGVQTVIINKPGTGYVIGDNNIVISGGNGNAIITLAGSVGNINPNLRLIDQAFGFDDIKLTGAGTTTITRTADTGITFTSTDTQENTTWYVRDSADADKTVNNSKYLKFVTATGALGTALTGTGTTGDPYLMTLKSPDTNTQLGVATSSALGGIELGSNTALTQTYETGVTGVANRTYPVQLNAARQAAVSVPWLSGGTYNWDVRDNASTPVNKTLLTGEVLQFKTATGALATGVAGTGTSADPYVMTLTSPNDNTTYSDFIASTAGAVGTAGLVPAPAAGTQGGTYYLNGNKSFSVPPDTTYSNFTAATAAAAGSPGLVPGPAATYQNRFLRGDATWQIPDTGPNDNTTYSIDVPSSTTNINLKGANPSSNDAIALTSGTYVSVTRNSASQLTFDLSAVNGTDTFGTRFLSKDNTWDVPTATNIEVIVTQSGLKFYLNGVIQADNTLMSGFTYRFNQEDSTNSGHPFRFSTNANNSPAAPYTTDVTTNGTPGSAGAYTQIIVTKTTPNLYYYCNVHSNMGGSAPRETTFISLTTTGTTGTSTLSNGVLNVPNYADSNDNYYVTAASYTTGTLTLTRNGGLGSLTATGFLQVGTAATDALAGDTTTITAAQTTAITANTAKVTDSGLPAILSNGTVPSLNTNITGAEVRTLIGAGTGDGDGDVTLTGVQTLTNKTLTIPKIDVIEPSAAVLTIKGTGSLGGDAKIILNCYVNSHGQTLAAQPHSAGVTNTMLLPTGANSTLVAETTSTLAGVTGRGASTSTASTFSGGINSGVLNVNGSGSNGYLYVTGNSQGNQPTNNQGMAFSYNNNAGLRENELFWNPGIQTAAENATKSFIIINQYLDSANSNARVTDSLFKLYGNGNLELTGPTATSTIANTYWRMPKVAGAAGQILARASSTIDLVWTTLATGDITGVTAGTGMTGGGTSGNVTLNAIGGNGITANANNITMSGSYTGDLTVTGDIVPDSYRFRANLANPTTSTATLYDQSSVGATISAYRFAVRNSDGTNMLASALFTNTSLTVVGDVIAFGSPSDIRLKENIKPIESALDKVSKLQGVTFNWKKSDSILDIKEDIGFIAQDVQKVLPELVKENKDGILSMRHQGIAPILLEAIKELKAEIEELKLNKCNCNK